MRLKRPPLRRRPCQKPKKETPPGETHLRLLAVPSLTSETAAGSGRTEHNNRSLSSLLIPRVKWLRGSPHRVGAKRQTRTLGAGAPLGNTLFNGGSLPSRKANKMRRILSAPAFSPRWMAVRVTELVHQTCETERPKAGAATVEQGKPALSRRARCPLALQMVRCKARRSVASKASSRHLVPLPPVSLVTRTLGLSFPCVNQPDTTLGGEGARRESTVVMDGCPLCVTPRSR